MKVAGIILIVLQLIVTIVSIIAGDNPFNDGICEIIGYFLVGIIGIILLIVDYRRKEKQKSKQEQDKTNDFNEKNKYQNSNQPMKNNTVNYIEENKKCIIPDKNSQNQQEKLSESVTKCNQGNNKENIKCNYKEAYKSYLLSFGYKEYTPSGNPSTVYQYIKSVESVLEWENLTWIGLAFNISSIRRKYDRGGISQTQGELSHNTVINALRRFEEFVDSKSYI